MNMPCILSTLAVILTLAGGCEQKASVVLPTGEVTEIIWLSRDTTGKLCAYEVTDEAVIRGLIAALGSDMMHPDNATWSTPMSVNNVVVIRYGDGNAVMIRILGDIYIVQDKRRYSAHHTMSSLNDARDGNAVRPISGKDARQRTGGILDRYLDALDD